MMPPGFQHPMMQTLASAGKSERLPMMAPLRDQPREEKDWDFYAEPIQGWRAWNVVEYDGVLLIQSITYKVDWMPRQEMVAECIARASLEPAPKFHKHLAPDIEHGCGIHSVKHFKQAMRWKDFGVNNAKKPVRVIGKVHLWGHVFRFTEGFLSEYAYPSMLYVPTEPSDWFPAEPEEIRRDLSATYGVEAKFL